MYHSVGIWTGGAGSEYVATHNAIQQEYHAIGGPGDNGCNEEDVLNYYQSKGFANGTKLLGWLSVDPTNVLEMQQAIWLFETLYFGTPMPNQWLSPMPQGDGFIWDVAGRPNPQNGHAYVATGYDARGVKINTWGMLGTCTYAAIAQYNAQNVGGELYVMLSPDMMNKSIDRAPNGFNWFQLCSDFNLMGGGVPIPTPPDLFKPVAGQSPIPDNIVIPSGV
jgi:hypothetical protein